MNIPEYNNPVLNLANIKSNYNESLMSIYDDSIDHNMNYSVGSFDFAILLQQFLSKISDNQTTHDLDSSSQTKSFSSSDDENSYRLLSIISLWFVLLINPIVIIFGVIGNLFATYLLINCNIVKLPVSFYTIMLNISDTFNLLIPVFIFWLDNCFNRTPEHGYFRDKSNFLCKVLMCPDQLFSALSAWYMCAISFNRWYSIWRPSSYFSQHSLQLQSSRNNSISINNNLTNEKKQSSGPMVLPSLSSLITKFFSINCCYFVTDHIKYRQHLQAFRSIGLITLLGILFCLYPIFMHELRPIISTNQHFFDLTQKMTDTYPVVWKRCYYSRKYEYAYDIIGIILSCLLHVLPLTFVAVMNIMIIIRLRQRRHRMSNSTYLSTLIRTECVRLNYTRRGFLFLSRKNKNNSGTESSSQLTITHKDQSTSTDLPNRPQVNVKVKKTKARRHHSRDRTITIMLVSVALSYLILTIPYRLFWSYYVYIKRMHPEKLNSSIYLLKMHYIDHVLRTIRNIHYSTNFIFFIILSKTFRRKVQQLFREKFQHTSNQSFNRKIMKRRKSKELPLNLEETNETYQNQIEMTRHDNIKQQIVNETTNLIDNTPIQEGKLHSIVELKLDDRFRVSYV